MKLTSLRNAIEKLGGTAVINVMESGSGVSVWLEGTLNGYNIQMIGDNARSYSVKKPDKDLKNPYGYTNVYLIKYLEEACNQ